MIWIIGYKVRSRWQRQVDINIDPRGLVAYHISFTNKSKAPSLPLRKDYQKMTSYIFIIPFSMQLHPERNAATVARLKKTCRVIFIDKLSTPAHRKC